VEAGLGIGFVPCLAIEKALRLGAVKAIQFQEGPIRRELSVVLLNGPDPKGPIGTIVELVREHGANHRNSQSTIHMHDESAKVVVMSGVNSVDHEKMAF
jgi:DNA-binding transcriptional LysR family regulator